jgi:class 3 adenylate cyclase/tetratricopeptide (TPR) repeat protein
MGSIVICQTCGKSNREGARFCYACGTSLARSCGTCGTDLRADAGFCDHCGTPVDSAEPRAAESPIPDDGAVRKTVTVLFADLVGSTAFGEQVDAESARGVMGTYHALAQSVIDGNGGTIAKFIGDGVMAVFGIPEIAEDDAVRAVEAGVDLQAGFEEIAAHVHDQYAIEVGLRVGVNTGEIVIAEEDADLVGDAINTAARIEAECTPGEVLVGEPTWRLTRSAVDYEALGEVSVKGKEDPVGTYQVLATARDDELQTPFVGREAELAQLTRVFDAATRDGQAHLVTIVGDPGVGKTRLAAELGDHTSSRARTFELRVEQSGTTSFGPVADLVRTTTGLDDSNDPGAVVDQIRDFLGPDVADASRLAPLLAGFVGAGPTRSTEESFWATRRLVEVLARDEPVVLVIDDVQWAEPLFLDLIEHLVDWVSRPALLLGLARPELRELRPSLVEIGRRVSDVVNLEGLDAAATEALAARMLGTDELPDGLADRLPESTDGNPLFVRELVRMLVDDGVITRAGRGWELAIDSEAVDVPPTIQSLLASRIERMPTDERRLVEMASVVGTEFALGALRNLMPAVSPTEVEQTLERLRRKDIIEATGNYWGDEPLLRFHHVLFRDAAYRRLLKQRRVELHLQTARWTEETAARFAGEHQIAIAHHYERAHEYLTDLGSVDAETFAIGRRAAELLHIAAQSALDQDDLAAAGSLARRALARLDADARERSELLLIACEALLSSGDMRVGRPLLDELAEIAAGSDRLESWVDAFEGQWVVMTQPGQLGSAEPVVAEAADRLEKLDDQAGVAKARLVRALILARLGRVGDCEAELDQALTAARAAGDRRRITAVLGAAPPAALWGPSPVARAGGRCLDIIRLLRITSASPIVEATSIRCQGVLEAMRGRFDQARDLIERARTLVEDLGTTHGLFETEMFAGLVELLAGNPADAELHLRDAYSGLRQLGVGSDAGQAAALLARALVAQERFDEAEDLAVDSDALAGQNLQTAIVSRTTRAEIAAARGSHGEALALAEEAVALAAATDLTFNHARAVTGLATVQTRAGDTSGASTSLTEARRLYEAKGAVPLTVGSPEAGAATSPTVSRVQFTNRAGRQGEALWERLYGQRDLDAAIDLLAEDVEISDRRPLLRNDVTKPDVRNWFGKLVESGTPIDWEHRVLAVRGEDLCLSSCTATSPDPTFGGPIIGIGQLDGDGRICHYSVYDPEGLQAAIEELDRRWLETDPDVPADVIRTARSFEAACRTGDLDAMQALQADDFVFTDHRPAALPKLDAQGFRDAMTALVDQIDDLALFDRQYHRVSRTRCLGTTHRLGRTNDGGEVSWLEHALFTVVDGHIREFELFTEDDLDAALSRFDTLESTHPVRLTNAAVEAGQIGWAAWYDLSDPDAGRYLALLADDFTVEDRRALSLADMSRADVAAYRDDIVRSQEQVEWDFEPLAIRGDRLALGVRRSRRVGSTFGTEFLWLVELTDQDNLMRTHVNFDIDALPAAIEELDRRWIEIDPDVPADVVGVVRSLQAAVGSRDHAKARSLLADDFALIDHRDFEQPTLDADGFIDRAMTTATQIGEYTIIARRYHRVSATRALVTTDRFGSHADHGGEVAWTAIDLFSTRDGLISGWEMLEEAELESAITHFDALESAHPAARLSNAAVEAGEMFCTAWYDRATSTGPAASS